MKVFLRWRSTAKLKSIEKIVKIWFLGFLRSPTLSEHPLKISERYLHYSGNSEHFYPPGCLKMRPSNEKNPVAKDLFLQSWPEHSIATRQKKGLFTPVSSVKFFFPPALRNL